MKLCLTLIAVAAAAPCLHTTCEYKQLGFGNFRTSVISMVSTLENFKCGKEGDGVWKEGDGCACDCDDAHKCSIQHATGKTENPLVVFDHCDAVTPPITCACDSPSFAFLYASNWFTCTDGSDMSCGDGMACTNDVGDCAPTNAMNSGQRLTADMTMQSEGAAFKLTLGLDGNLEIVHNSDGSDGSVMWSSNTAGTDATDGKFTVQNDGNVVYRTANGDVIWAAQTHTYGVPGMLVLQNDGDLVLSRVSDDHVMWSSSRGGKQ